MDVLERIEKIKKRFEFIQEAPIKTEEEHNVAVALLINEDVPFMLDELGKQMQWVSIIKDGLPEDGRKVDIYVNKYIKRLPDCTYKKERNQFYNGHVGMIKWFDVKKVSHWISIPPSPKEAE